MSNLLPKTLTTKKQTAISNLNAILAAHALALMHTQQANESRTSDIPGSTPG